MAVNQENLNGESHSAGQQEHIALVDAANVGAAQQVQTDYGGNQAEYRVPPRLLPQEEPQKGNEYNVHGGQKTGFPGIGVQQADLLQAAGHEQGNAADNAGFPQSRVLPAGPEALFTWKQRRDRK